MAGNSPREHHYVPRFWQERFSVGNREAFIYDEDKGLVEKPVSNRLTMVLRDLNTIKGSGIFDVSAETDDFGQVDNDGAVAWQALLDSHDQSEAVRSQFADFLTMQTLRVPKCRARYHSGTWRLLEAIAELLPDSSTVDELNQKLVERRFPAGVCAANEFTQLKLMSKGQLEDEIAALSSRIGLDHADAPWTDLFRSPQVRQSIKAELLAQRWSLMVAPDDVFVLGDTGIVFNSSDLASGARVPISSSAALFIEPSNQASIGIGTMAFDQHLVNALNLESASWAERWVIAADKDVLREATLQRESRMREAGPT